MTDSPENTGLNLDLAEVSTRVANRIRRRSGRGRSAVDDKIRIQLERSREWVSKRRATIPLIDYPSELPVSQKLDDIRSALNHHQVVVVDAVEILSMLTSWL